MTPQSHFMLVAPIAAGRESDLRALLNSMNNEPGLANPYNNLLSFGAFSQLHFARLVLLDDGLQSDLLIHGKIAPKLPTYLAFLGDCDGPAREFLADLALRAGEGLRRLLSHCEGFTGGSDLLTWMLAHNRSLAANYVNWVGRTVLQVQQESALQRALSTRVPRTRISNDSEAQSVREELIAFVKGEVHAGRLTLTVPSPTPLGWRVATLLHALVVPLIGLALLPVLLVLMPLIVWLLRMHETTDPELCPSPQKEALEALQELEDRDVTNQYTALGAVKPGLFRRWLVTVLLVLVDYACRHIFTRGHLGRVQTIHFARWVFLDNKTRVVFASNYDGSHQSYMDDFINKVAWGLNLVFSNGVGWPRTRWLISGGARIEQKFKRFQRRHQLPTQVWYKAYPGLTLVDLKRNHEIRKGMEATTMTFAQTIAWLKLL